jgi:hypothetical protein
MRARERYICPYFIPRSSKKLRANAVTLKNLRDRSQNGYANVSVLAPPRWRKRDRELAASPWWGRSSGNSAVSSAVLASARTRQECAVSGAL